MAKTPDDAPVPNKAAIAMASLDNFIKRSRSFMETEPRIVQRYVGFIAVLSQFCDSYDEFALSNYGPALKLALSE